MENSKNDGQNISGSGAIDANITSGKNLSYWLSTAKEPIVYESLKQNVNTEVLVVGGGIAGLTTAYCLAKEGLKVILVEDGYIGSGESGRTTAHITCALDDRYYDLEKIFDKETAALAANSHAAAIEWIEKLVKLHGIECHFKRVSGYLFLDPTDKKENLDKEYEATKVVGLITRMLAQIPGISAEDGHWCIEFPDQAQFHILMYLRGLANAFVELGGSIYTQSKAMDVFKDEIEVNGFKVRAKHVVIATNTPINDHVIMHSRQFAYRTYVIAGKVPKGKLPYALWWDTGDQDSKWITAPYHYVRLEEFDDEYDMLIAGGEDHRTGQADEEHIKEQDRYIKLEDWTKKRFPMLETIDYRWSGQVMEPADSLAFIGKYPGQDKIYVITGDSGNGMTHGTLGGIIIKDIIMGNNNPWIKVYNPSRITIKATGDYLHEFGNMAAQYMDWISKDDIKEADDLKPGHGGIISSGLKRIALYRDENNNLHACTAVCPHMGGIVHWNAEEKTFDCPVHGSRFSADGTVVNGPATTELKKINIGELHEAQDKH